ncbi:hypothetical protein [Desulfocucumis palustris]|uniref:hypothetical protein n=1 Tax=Desulfocucumis palustris TaxID=1898651 RepID=UPI000CEA52A2|nr:hypothetical protein [Desulfocucumis palustris]
MKGDLRKRLELLSKKSLVRPNDRNREYEEAMEAALRDSPEICEIIKQLYRRAMAKGYSMRGASESEMERFIASDNEAEELFRKLHHWNRTVLPQYYKQRTN